MTVLKEIMDKVDPDLVKLLEASNKYQEYHKITAASTTAQVNVSGVLGLQISPNRHLGFSLNQRG